MSPNMPWSSLTASGKLSYELDPSSQRASEVDVRGSGLDKLDPPAGVRELEIVPEVSVGLSVK